MRQRTHAHTHAQQKRTIIGPFERVIIGVLSNSDDRISVVLESLGVSVGSYRADQDVTSGRLPGFEGRGDFRSRLNQSRMEDGSGDGNGNGSRTDIDLVITSYEAGEEKPDPLIFRVAERQAERVLLDWDSSSVASTSASVAGAGEWTRIHIGDDLEKDFRAALRAGWDAFYLPRDGDGVSDTGVRTIGSLAGLIPKLEGYR